jgi:hypothetical protein
VASGTSGYVLKLPKTFDHSSARSRAVMRGSGRR